MNLGLRWWRTLGALLVLSLCLNVFLGAREFAHFIRPPPPMSPGFIDRIASKLPPQDAEILRAAIPQPPDFARFRALQERVAAALRAKTFDPAALSAAMEAVRADRAKFETGVARALLQAAERLSPQARIALADELERFRPGPPAERPDRAPR